MVKVLRVRLTGHACRDTGPTKILSHCPFMRARRRELSKPRERANRCIWAPILRNSEGFLNQPGTQTPCAHVSVLVSAVKHYPHFLKVRKHLTLGSILSMADVIAYYTTFSTNLATSHCVTSCYVFIDLRQLNMITFQLLSYKSG